jgi:mannitol/fructose-specific phosphotransferase system IIA component (Ntr-type)
MDLSLNDERVEPVRITEGEKRDVIAELAGALAARHGLTAAQLTVLRESALKREESLSTGMEKGIAVPHGRLDGESRLFFVAGVSANPVEWGTLDGSGVRIVVLFAVPADAMKEYRRALGELMGALSDPETRRTLVRRANEGRST